MTRCAVLLAVLATIATTYITAQERAPAVIAIPLTIRQPGDVAQSRQDALDSDLIDRAIFVSTAATLIDLPVQPIEQTLPQGADLLLAGSVVGVRASTGTDGLVETATVVRTSQTSTDSRLEAAALGAVLQARFPTVSVAGNPVKYVVIVPVRFLRPR
jgi:hypothetical protein